MFEPSVAKQERSQECSSSNRFLYPSPLDLLAWDEREHSKASCLAALFHVVVVVGLCPTDHPIQQLYHSQEIGRSTLGPATDQVRDPWVIVHSYLNMINCSLMLSSLRARAHLHPIHTQPLVLQILMWRHCPLPPNMPHPLFLNNLNTYSPSSTSLSTPHGARAASVVQSIG